MSLMFCYSIGGPKLCLFYKLKELQRVKIARAWGAHACIGVLRIIKDGWRFRGQPKIDGRFWGIIMDGGCFEDNTGLMNVLGITRDR